MADYNSSYSSTPLADRDKFYETVPLCYIYKKKGFQVVLSRVFDDKTNPYKTEGWSVMLVGANILPTENAESKNPRLDWTNAIRIKVSMQELSNFSRYSDLSYIKSLGAVLPALDPETGEIKKDKNGKIVGKTDKKGNTIIIKESIYHEFDGGSGVRFNFVKSKYDYNGAQIFMEKNGNKFFINLDMNELIMFAKCCQFAFEFMCKAAIDEKEGLYEAWKKAKLDKLGKGGSGKSYSSNSSSSSSSKSSGYSGKSYSSGDNEEYAPKPVSYRDQLANGGDDEAPNFNFGSALDDGGDDIPF